MPLQGVSSYRIASQGDALGWKLTAPLGRDEHKIQKLFLKHHLVILYIAHNPASVLHSPNPMKSAPQAHKIRRRGQKIREKTNPCNSVISVFLLTEPSLPQAAVATHVQSVFLWPTSKNFYACGTDFKAALRNATAFPRIAYPTSRESFLFSYGKISACTVLYIIYMYTAKPALFGRKHDICKEKLSANTTQVCAFFCIFVYICTQKPHRTHNWTCTDGVFADQTKPQK